jgi:hypothetical protein
MESSIHQADGLIFPRQPLKQSREDNDALANHTIMKKSRGNARGKGLAIRQGLLSLWGCEYFWLRAGLRFFPGGSIFGKHLNKLRYNVINSAGKGSP